jgi:hypothetical protein
MEKSDAKLFGLIARCLNGVKPADDEGEALEQWKHDVVAICDAVFGQPQAIEDWPEFWPPEGPVSNRQEFYAVAGAREMGLDT